jgi:hypothetical protein
MCAVCVKQALVAVRDGDLSVLIALLAKAAHTHRINETKSAEKAKK